MRRDKTRQDTLFLGKKRNPLTNTTIEQTPVSLAHLDSNLYHQ